jgi:hypothetical protein
MRDIKCPMKGCEAMLTRNEASINNHLRLSHRTTPEQRMRLRIRLLGDQRIANAEKKAARCNAQREKALQKVTGVS